MVTRPFFTSLLAVAIALPTYAAEREPLSAIDWLSDSVTEPPPETSVEQPSVATLPPEIQVLPLDAPVADDAGLIEAAELGLDPGIWGRSSAADLARGLSLLADTPDAPPSLRRFLIDLMQARLKPPIDALADDSFYLARVDRLLALGHLDTALALIDAAGQTHPQSFRRAFDIALLTGEETKACRVIEETPDLSPTYPARIFCLARLGQWDVAALTLGNAETLGILNQDEDALLLHFLDPELFEGDDIPPAPRLPTPLQFRLYEAVGERIPTDQLPVAFAVADLSDTVGWKTRLRAAERLAATEALDFETLLEIYFERMPAASGGIWTRVEAIQDLVRAVLAGDAERIDEALPAAWLAAREAGFHAGFANWMGAHLEQLELSSARHLAFEIALINGNLDVAADFASKSAEDQFLMALARGENGVPPDADALGRAVLRGLSAIGPDVGNQALIEDDRSGEALFRALAQLAEGAAGNPDATEHSLALLRAIGLADLARQVAVELVLMEGAA